MHAHAQAEAVEERHRRQHTVTGAEHRVRRDDLLAEGVEILVRQHDALCRAGRPSGNSSVPAVNPELPDSSNRKAVRGLHHSNLHSWPI